MVLKTSAGAPITCSDWDDLVDNDGFLALGRNRYHCTYIIHTDGTYYYAENGATGNLDYGGPTNEGLVIGTDAAAVIHAAWGNMTDGGRIIVKGDINLGTTPLSFSLTKYQTSLEFIGLGETATTFTYTGTGYAMTFTTADVAVGYYYLKLQGFYLTCSAKTAGRHGIHINDIGRTVVLDHVKIWYPDVGIRIEDDSNEVYLYNVRIVTCNTGIYTTPAKCNEASFINCEIIESANYGYYFDGGNAMRIYGGAVRPAGGIGLYTNYTWTLNVDGVYFHDTGSAFTCHIKLSGTNATFRTEAAMIKSCYFNATANANHAIEVEWALSVTIDTCRSRNHNNAFIYLYDHAHDLTLVNNHSTDPFLFDSEVLTEATARFSGTVVEARRVGFMAVNDDADACDEGDVMVPTGRGLYAHNGGVLNDDNPSVCMYGQANAKPIVMCMKGITLVEMEAAVTLDDTIVTSNTNTNGETNNAQTDPKKIIGYAAETTVGAGTAYTRIL